MISEKIIVGEGSEYPLNGLLTIPDGEGPFPAVVMVHGSGPSNMDEKVMKLTAFKDIAEGLAERGIASIRYDKRTFAHKKKCAKLKAITVRDETIDDALLAAELLKKDPRIDPGRVFILGHSMGAMLAPRIDAEGADAAGLIMLAATPYRLEEIVLRQLAQAKGKNPLVNWIIGLELKTYTKKFSGLYEMADEEAEKKKFGGTLPLSYFKEMGRKTAADYLLESKKPALIMQGGKDYQVLADDDFAKFKELLADRPNTVLKLYPNLNHVFVEGIYDDILKASKDYSIERHIGEEVIDDIAAFISTPPRDSAE